MIETCFASTTDTTAMIVDCGDAVSFPGMTTKSQLQRVASGRVTLLHRGTPSDDFMPSLLLALSPHYLSTKFVRNLSARTGPRRRHHKTTQGDFVREGSKTQTTQQLATSSEGRAICARMKPCNDVRHLPPPPTFGYRHTPLAHVREWPAYAPRQNRTCLTPHCRFGFFRRRPGRVRRLHRDVLVLCLERHS